MKIRLLIILALLAGFTAFSGTDTSLDKGKPLVYRSDTRSDLYSELHLDRAGLNRQAFEKAEAGYRKLLSLGHIKVPGILSIADLSQSSTCKRLYVIDLEHGKLLYHTYVAHGKNTGEEYARSFSNQPESNKSSLGFYSTLHTYFGEHGLSLKLHGEERGFNDQAEARSIVVHGADYVSEQFISSFGRLGRSFGCPSLPREESSEIINHIKDGTCFFIYYPDQQYLRHSALAGT